jgi:hypothetical protein
MCWNEGVWRGKPVGRQGELGGQEEAYISYCTTPECPDMLRCSFETTGLSGGQVRKALLTKRHVSAARHLWLSQHLARPITAPAS